MINKRWSFISIFLRQIEERDFDCLMEIRYVWRHSDHFIMWRHSPMDPLICVRIPCRDIRTHGMVCKKNVQDAICFHSTVITVSTQELLDSHRIVDKLQNLNNDYLHPSQEIMSRLILIRFLHQAQQIKSTGKK
jgi:hypothetical protein